VVRNKTNKHPHLFQGCAQAVNLSPQRPYLRLCVQ
jgi:hypothetical protein